VILKKTNFLLRITFGFLAKLLAFAFLLTSSCAFDNEEKFVGGTLVLWSMENRLFYLVDKRSPDDVGGILGGSVLYACYIQSGAIFGFRRLNHIASLEWAVVNFYSNEIDSAGSDDDKRILHRYGVDIDTVSNVRDFFDRL